ncbi:MAG: hypothetical protein M0R80_20235 [Proteobacteria bacterium]|jgi:hypothetical protein|nr:hypothetical protein [Pseudomonadota bacterium]
MNGESTRRLAFCALLAGAALSSAGCEETLEACAPCGVPSAGAVNVSGDPRLDGEIEAAVRAWQWGRRAEAGFDANVDALAHAVGYAHAEGPSGTLHATAADVEQIAALLRAALFEQVGVATVIELEAPRCFADMGLALERQISCELSSGCYVGSGCEEALASCAGLCVGRCATESGSDAEDACGGFCYQEVDAGADPEECLSRCVGTCAGGSVGPCAGRCRGTCSAGCSSYTADGACDGACPGNCDGTCSSAAPFDCDGICYGSCRVEADPETGCAGVCRGDCAGGVCDGACRGHVRPEGCDMPSRCSGVLACQEVAKDLAWAYMACEPATARVHVELGAAFTGDAAALVDLAALLERALTAFQADFGRLSLLVDGVDPVGEIEPEDLVEPADAAARPYAVTDHEDLVAAGVPDERAGLPLFAMRARVSWLASEATGGEYEIAAGSMSCIRPALEEALELLDGLIPIEERDTSGSDPAEWPEPVIDRTRGLFRVLDGAAVLLGLDAEAGK